MQLETDLTSCSPGHRDELPEDQQEGNCSTDIVEVVLWIRGICNLPLASSEGRMVHGFRAGQDPNDQPSSSYLFLLENLSAISLAGIDDCIRYLNFFPVRACVATNIISSREKCCYAFPLFPELFLSLEGCVHLII